MFTECPSGIFGSDCTLPCHCANGDICDPITGRCPAACASGLVDNDNFNWTGPSCQLGKLNRLLTTNFLCYAKV